MDYINNVVNHFTVVRNTPNGVSQWDIILEGTIKCIRTPTALIVLTSLPIIFIWANKRSQRKMISKPSSDVMSVISKEMLTEIALTQTAQQSDSHLLLLYKDVFGDKYTDDIIRGNMEILREFEVNRNNLQIEERNLKRCLQELDNISVLVRSMPSYEEWVNLKQK